jgi:predicted house-cleaning noncanonical NTP pyrophosphatase (MazG superfamily)
MRKFKFSKLVRDNIVEQIIAVGNIPHWRELSDMDYLRELKDKLIEEAKEISNASGGELIKELADIQEIIDNLLVRLNISKEEFINIQQKKKEKDGSFFKRHFIDEVDVQDDSEWVSYYTRNPNKYSEIHEV